LEQYQVTGIPTTNGTPNTLVFFFGISGIGDNVIKNINVPGTPLALTGATTFERYPSGIRIFDNQFDSRTITGGVNSFSITLKDQLGNDLIYSSATFWLRVKRIV